MSKQTADHNKAHGRRDGGDAKPADSGVGKNDRHGDGENHSQTPKSSGSKEGGSGNWANLHESRARIVSWLDFYIIANKIVYMK